MDIVSMLQELGFTEYEAKVYCALVRFPGSTGYETGGHSKVPRARVYEVLESLQEKGMVYSQTVDGRQLYYPQPHGTMLSQLTERLAGIADTLHSALDRIASDNPEPQFLVFKKRDQVFARVRQLCRQARFKLLVSGWPEDLVAIGPDLKAAQDRGVEVYVLCFGQVDLPVDRIFHHTVTPLQYLQVSVIGRWLLLVRDVQDCLIVQVSGAEQTAGLLSKGPLVSFIVAQWIYHDIAALVYAEELSRMPDFTLAPEKQALLQGILEWKPDDAEGLVGLPEDAPEVRQVFEQIEKRLASHPSLAAEIGGLFEFRISGKDGGVFHIDLRAGRIEVAEGPARSPELVLELSSRDFRGLALGVLPLPALYTPGRIKVRGNITLAAKLRELLNI
ncbi:MAG: helix-turn-helix domain-containing protein [Bacillota bacterium]|jgi:sugar-specific transcriptional regulator TrmB/putative sterol carrier protein|nr:hypothetical protein [Candidatus Fermentithermobacillaceae bacterium]